MSPNPPDPTTLAQICPVCNGRGNLPHGFYLPPTPDGTFTSSNTAPETCRTCNGLGVLVAALTPEPTCSPIGHFYLTGNAVCVCGDSFKVQLISGPEPAPPSAPSVGGAWCRDEDRLYELADHAKTWVGHRMREGAVKEFAAALVAAGDKIRELRALRAACGPALNDANGSIEDLRHRLHVAEQARDALRTAHEALEAGYLAMTKALAEARR